MAIRPVERPPERPLTARPSRRGRGRIAGVVGLVAGAIAVLGCLALPFAPVVVEQPTVSWPQDPAAPTSTSLPLSAQRPLALEASWDCATAQRAADAPGRFAGVVLATVLPERAAQARGLVVTADRVSGRLTARVGTTVLSAGPLLAGPCTYALTTRDGDLVLARDGAELGRAPLPEVDALVTGVAATDPGGLRAVVHVDNRYASTPSALKRALMAVVAVAAVVAVVGLVRSRPRARPRAPARRRVGVPADLAVVAVLVVWLFLAPVTHDDGWMYAMARNAEHAGYFGNYYMYRNNGYVPFTWLLWLYAEWGRLGAAPVLQRVPSLAFALVAWGSVRAALAPLVTRRAWWWVPALVFLAWWLPYGLGTRQEASVAACLTLTVAALLVAQRRGHPAWLGLAVGAATMGVIAHTAGVLALVPLLLSLPMAARILRRAAPAVRDRVALALGVLSCAALSAFAAFGDGTLADFRRGQASFGGSSDAADDPGGGGSALVDEVDRYRLLLTDPSMGNFAMRTPVLLMLVGLVVFLALAHRGHRGRPALPRPVWLCGWTCLLGLAVLLVTPSKWSWHFGAFAGVATVLLAGLAARATRARVRPRRTAAIEGAAVLALLVGWALLASRGQNWWGDNVMAGVPRFDQPLAPVAVVVAVLVVVGLVAWRRRRSTTAVAVALVAVFLAAELTVLVGGFAVAAARTRDTWSPWADAVTDPLARRCGEGSVLRVADLDAARAMPVLVPGEQASGGTVAGAGGTAPSGPATRDLRTVAPRDGTPGVWSGPWLALPSGPDDLVVTTISGSTGPANRLEAEFGVPTPTGMATTAQTVYAAPEDDTAWRDVAITRPGTAPPGAVAVRLRAVAEEATLVVAAPTVRTMRPVAEALPTDGRTLVDWPLTWLHPCQGQPPVAQGIGGAVADTLVFGAGPIGTPFSGTTGGTWDPRVGGQLAPQLRTSTLVRRYTELRTDPGYPMRTVYRLERPFPDGAYDLTVGGTETPGWRSPG